MSFGLVGPRSLCAGKLLKESLPRFSRPSFLTDAPPQLSHLVFSRSRFSTSSSISFPPKSPPTYQPRAAPPRPSSPPSESQPGSPSTLRLSSSLPKLLPYHPLNPSQYIPPPPYSPSHHDSLRLGLTKNTISPSQRLELDALDNELLAYKLAVEEKQVADSLGFVPLNGTYEIGEKLLARFEKTKETTEARWVWREFCIPLNVRVNGGNGVLFTGVTDNTGWFVLPYVLFFVGGTLVAYAVAAQLTESSVSETHPSYTGFVVATSLLSFLAFVPWFASGSLQRLILHSPTIMNLAPFTTWNSLRGIDPRALFSRGVAVFLSPLDLMVIRTTESRLALGGLTEKLRWKPFRAGCGRMWLGMFSHRDTTHFYRSIFMLWVSGYLAYGYFSKEDNSGTEGVFSYVRRMIGTYFPEYASKPETEDEKKVASAPQPKKTGVYEYLVFVVTAGAFAAFVAQLHHSFVLLPKAANRLHTFVTNPSSIRSANPPWFMVPAPEVKQQKTILGDGLVNMLGVDRLSTGLTEPGLALSALALLHSCSNGGPWVLGTVPAIVPAVFFGGRYIIQDLSSIKRDWNTPRRHFGAGTAFGIIYFFFGSTFFAWSVSNSGEIVIPPYDPNAPPEAEKKEVAKVLEVDPTWETYVFNGKTIKMPPRRSS
ncbi:hypothetical protein BDY24DRAFT_402503 [Mrakia frigida]|uniref:uncharacterized protein n=1 Tax=Mrakia frigida TaxID=29902 RepID=UPI003FCC1B7C